MDLLVADKTVVVTGSSGGLGRAIATQYAKEGANVIISSRNEEKLKTTRKEIMEESKNNHVHYVVADTGNEASLIRLVAETIQVYGSIDILVNSTGGPKAGALFDVQESDWEQAFQQLLLGVVRLTKLVIPYMEKQEAGRIINITSTSMKAPIDNLLLSNTIRPAIWGFTKDIARQYASQNILINAVGPGSVSTDRVKELNTVNAQKQGVSYESFVKNREHDIPVKRFAEPEEFANAVLFLGSFANSYVTGQALLVDGGFTTAL